MNRKILYFFFIVFLCPFLNGCDMGTEIFFNNDPDEYVTENLPFQETEASFYVEKEEKSEGIYVSVLGEVVSPGIYLLPFNSRVYEAINAAGGVGPKGDISSLNLVDIIQDGVQIVVPSTEDDVPEISLKAVNIYGGNKSDTKDGMVNINTADVQELQTLPGIGEVRAVAIVDYRNKNGEFTSIEELKNVSGIKEGTFEKIMDKIKVR